MKKLLVVLVVVAFGFAFTSCKKECKCKIGIIDWTIPSEAAAGSKEDCDKIKDIYQDFGVSCDWK